MMTMIKVGSKEEVALLLAFFGVLNLPLQAPNRQAPKRAGRSGGEVALMVAVGSLVILVVMLGILMWGFRDFG
jgi:hypothetical protein